MAASITKPFPVVKRFTLTVSDQLFEIRVPLSSGKVSIQFIDNPGKLTFEGIHDEPIGADYGTIKNDVWFEVNWGPAPDKYNAAKKVNFFVAAATVPTVVEVLVED